MRTRIRDGLLTAGVLLSCTTLCPAHGGIYRGPGDVVPPSSGGGHGGNGSGNPGGPTTGGPTTPSGPSPSGPRTGGGSPTTGGGSAPSGGSPGSTTPRGVQLDPDLTEWRYWWEFNKDSYLQLKAKVHAGTETGSDDFWLGPRRRATHTALKPTDEQIVNEILPALKKAIDSTDQRDINSSCMVAMAKIGTNHPDFRLIDVWKPRLREPDQEIREVAALAIGIAAIAGEEEVDLLADLALDRPQARDLRGGSIDHRTRSFAAYGLGLLAHETSQTAIKARAFTALAALLRDERIGDRNVKVAAINAIGILNIDPATDADRRLQDEALQCLEGYYLKGLGSGEQLIQAHCPTAIAKLIGRDHAKVDHYKALFAADLQEKGKVKRSSNDIARSCAMALGMLARPCDDDDVAKCPDAPYSTLLLSIHQRHKDAQTRNFAVLALGQIGGERNRAELLKGIRRARNLEQPWFALALGVHEFARHAADNAVEPDRLVTATLGDALAEAKDPSVVGALAIGLGLARAYEAADRMRSLLVANVEKEEMAGHLCTGLALMNDLSSQETIRGVARNAIRRDTLLRMASVALGRLGDKQMVDDLLRMITDETDRNLAKLASAASALALIGDRTSIRPLTDMLDDTRLHGLSRAFAAVALGGIADKEPLPWTAKLSANLNYRAAVETLTDRSAGILDIL